MRFMGIGDLKVYCIKCNELNTINIEDFDKGQFLKCKRCGNRFNYYGLVHSFYESIFLAKEIVNTIVSHVYGEYLIKNSKEDTKKIIEFLENNDFGNLLHEIVFDTVLYGTSFVEKIKLGNEVKLSRLNPKMIEARTEFRSVPPAMAYTEELEKLIIYDTSGSVKREISYQDIMLFVGQPATNGPLGVSVFVFWLHSWFILKFGPRALRNLGLVDRIKGAREIEEIKKFEEDQVIIGSGIPPHYLIAPEQPREVKWQARQEESFRLMVKERQKRIASTVESEIFPLALGRDYDHETFPRFFWKE